MGTGLLEFMNIFTLGRGNPVSMSLLCFYSAATTNLETGLLKQLEQRWAALDTKVNLVPRVFSLFSFPNEKAWGGGKRDIVGGWKLVLIVGLVQSVSETKSAFHLSELIMNGLTIPIVMRAFHF